MSVTAKICGINDPEAMRAASKAEEEMKQKRAAVAMCAAREPRKTRALRM